MPRPRWIRSAIRLDPGKAFGSVPAAIAFGKQDVYKRQVLAGAIAERAGYVVMWRTMIIPVVIAVVLVIVFHTRITGVENAFKERAASREG